jgi:hypothetical protein
VQLIAKISFHFLVILFKVMFVIELVIIFKVFFI